jgi:hypothetical protein
MGEEVGDSIGVSGDVVEYEVKILQEFHPSGLPPSNLLWLTEVLKVFVICLDMNGVVSAKEVGAATLEPIYDGGHFLIVDIIVSFGGQEGTGVESYRVFFAVELLTDDHTEGKV